MNELENDLIQATVELDERAAIAAIDALLSVGEQNEIFFCIGKGTDQVVHKYQSGEYFIADLIMAGVIYNEAIRRVTEFTGRKLYEQEKSRIVIGVVRRDIHELGKNIVAGILEYNGYNVEDLGVDVPPEAFVCEIRKSMPCTLIMSGVMDISIVEMERTISLLEDEGIRDKVKVFLGGPCVTLDKSEQIGADGFLENYLDCLRLCRDQIDQNETVRKK